MFGRAAFQKESGSVFLREIFNKTLDKQAFFRYNIKEMIKIIKSDRCLL